MTSMRSACPAVALSALVLIATSGSADSHAMTNCSVSAIEGAPVRLQVAGQWRALEAGPLPDGAEAIATGPAARAEITCEADLVVTIGAGTEVSLDALRADNDTEPALLRLFRGIIGIDAPTTTFLGFEVETPLAVASARSTSWLVESAEVTGAAVFVRSGRVEVLTAERQPLAMLDEGEGITIVPGPDGSLPDPDALNVVEWGAGRIEGAADSLGFGWQ